MLDLILPPSIQKAASDKSKAVGATTPWRRGNTINGAAEKRGNWSTYYDMYSKHAIVRAAIDKIAKTATTSGFDFTPRDKRTDNNEAEVNILKEFFNKQPDFIEELQSIYLDLMIYGDGYLYIVPDRQRKPSILKRLAPNTIQIKAKANGEVIEYYQKIEGEQGTVGSYTTFKAHELLHFKILDPNNSLYGLSPLESLTWAVATDIYAMRYNAAFFQNSGVTGTIIAVKNANPDEIERNRKWFTENYTGPENAHTPVVIEGEEISVHKAVATHTEMGFLEGRKFIIMEILAVLDVPPVKVGMTEDANRSSSKEQDKTFRTESITPLQNRVESVINGRFIRDILGVKNTIFAHAQDDNRDLIEQMDYFDTAVKNGSMNINEVRARLGLKDVEGGSTNGIMTPTGYVPLDRMQLYFQIPRQNADKIPVSPDDPVEGEPQPKDDSSGVPLVQKDVYGLQQGLLRLSKNEADLLDLRKALGHLYEAAEGITDADDLIIRARNSLRKSLQSDDEMLKSIFLEQARDYASQILQVVQLRTREEI